MVVAVVAWLSNSRMVRTERSTGVVPRTSHQVMHSCQIPQHARSPILGNSTDRRARKRLILCGGSYLLFHHYQMHKKPLTPPLPITNPLAMKMNEIDCRVVILFFYPDTAACETDFLRNKFNSLGQKIHLEVSLNAKGNRRQTTGMANLLGNRGLSPIIRIRVPSTSASSRACW